MSRATPISGAELENRPLSESEIVAKATEMVYGTSLLTPAAGGNGNAGMVFKAPPTNPFAALRRFDGGVGSTIPAAAPLRIQTPPRAGSSSTSTMLPPTSPIVRENQQGSPEVSTTHSISRPSGPRPVLHTQVSSVSASPVGPPLATSRAGSGSGSAAGNANSMIFAGSPVSRSSLSRDLLLSYERGTQQGSVEPPAPAAQQQQQQYAEREPSGSQPSDQLYEPGQGHGRSPVVRKKNPQDIEALQRGSLQADDLLRYSV